MAKEPSLADLALDLARHRREKEEAEARAIQEARQRREKQGQNLLRDVLASLKDLKKLPGVKVKDRTVTIKNRRFTISVELTHWTARYSDDSPEQENCAYLAGWTDDMGRVHGGCSTPQEFIKAFAREISLYL